MPDEAPNPARKPWVPPAILAACAFAVGLGAGAMSFGEKLWTWFGPAKLPAVSEEYYMIRLVDGAADAEALRSQLTTLTGQVKGLKVVMSPWLDDTGTAVAQAVTTFCRQAQDPADCAVTVQPVVLLGTYGLKSFDPRSLTGLRVDLAALKSGSGVVDAYDGFIDGALSAEKKCLVSGMSGACLADWTGEETVADLPVLGPGEMVLLPIFLSVQMSYQEADGNWLSDGLAPTPMRFPARVSWDGRDLIAHPREMHETPSLQQGFYEGRG